MHDLAASEFSQVAPSVYRQCDERIFLVQRVLGVPDEPEVSDMDVAS